MILRIARNALLAHPLRTAVLGAGFGLGVGVMATLLGVGEVVLDQARAPALVGGGQLIVFGTGGPLTSARFVMSALLARARSGAAGSPPVPNATASPRRRAELFLVRPGPTARIIPVRARGGVPSLERALGDPETAAVGSWVDTADDSAWSLPDPAELIRAMDRFHPVPDVPARAASWAEWLYFKGQSGSAQFYLTFLAGPKRSDGRRVAGVRLQWAQGDRVRTYSATEPIDDAELIAGAPEVTIAQCRVRLDGLRYRIALDLPADNPAAAPRMPGFEPATRRTGARATGEIVIDAVAGRSLPPIEIRGAGGWVSGYTVPVMSGALGGTVTLDGERIGLQGTGYHDHNWGFWQGVSWRWGQVQHADRSYVYGRVYPPADAADAERIPGFLAALGPDGPVGYSTRVTIDESDDPATGRPRRIHVAGRGASLAIEMDVAVESAIVTPGGALAKGPDFLQLRGRYHVTGRVAGQAIDFIAPGAAETFRR
jgi:hypothetical protein